MNLSNDIKRENIQDIIALSPLQEGMIYQYIKNPKTNQYFQQFSLQLKGEIDLESFHKAWNFVLSENEMLRAIFAWKGLKRPIQIIQKKIDFSIKVKDLSHLQAEKQYEVIEEWKKEDRVKKFDLEKGPLFRLTLCKLSTGSSELFLSFHHILWDGWSTSVILQEFFTAYAAYVKDEEPAQLAKNQFKNYLKWLQGQNNDAERQFWQEYLRDVQESASLPRDHQPNDEIEEIACHQVFPSDNCLEKVQKVAREQKVTIGAFLYTIWGILLQIYNNTETVLFGTTISGRIPEIQGIENMVGLFINTLPLKITGGGAEKVNILMQRVHQEAQLRENYSGTSLAVIKSCSQIPPQKALFDSIMVIENYPFYQPATDHPLQIQSYTTLEMPNYDLTLDVRTFDQLDIRFIYNSQAFEQCTIERMGQHFINVIDQVLNKPDICLEEINPLTGAEKEKLIHKWNQTQVDYPQEKTISQLFTEQVAARPNELALVFQDQQLTYRQLDEKANQLARVFRQKGLGPEKVAAFFAQRSVETIVSVLAIVKAGGAYLPIDVKYPRERIEFMLEDVNATLLIIRDDTEELISDSDFHFSGTVLHLDRDDLFTGASCPIENVNSHQDLLYIIYTSGSTGKPKGVMIEHYNVTRLIKNSNMLPIARGDRILQSGSLAFDASTFEVWGALLNGATLYLVQEDSLLSPERLAKTLREYQITWLFLTTALFNQMVSTDFRIFQGLEVLIFGGETASPGRVNQAHQLYPHLQLIHAYGPTESTTFATYYPVTKEHEDQVPIGRPISNTQVYILDRYQNLAPIGVVGELCIGGDGLARGYLNRPELTEEKFVYHPLLKERIYRTGDLARWSADGQIEFVGRIDHQVKIRGFRVEPGEVESLLLEHPDVKEAIVIPRQEKDGTNYLCAYVVFREETAEEDLHNYLTNQLPSYMIPAHFVILDALPLNVNGKINRHALPEPNLQKMSNDQYIAPRDDLERKIAQIWAEVLDVERVGIDDDFFALGGHSLKAMSLVSRLYKELNQEIPLGHIFKYPTIRELVRTMEENSKGVYQAIKSVATGDYYPLTSTQKRLYLLDQLEGIGTSYNITGAVFVEGEWSWRRLERALKQMVERHSSLRTSFTMHEGEPVQIIAREIDFTPDYIEIDGKWDEKEAKELLTDFVRPFDLNVAPLIRAQLVHWQDRDLLMLDMHHIISDGSSMEIFISELLALEAGLELPELNLEFKDIAIWQEQDQFTAQLEKAEEYWLAELAGELPILDLPADHPRPPVFNFQGETLSFTIDSDLKMQLEELAARESVTLYMLLLGAFHLLLHRYTGQKDILVGSPIAGRTHPDVENIIGMFVNTLVLRKSISPSATFKEILAQTKEKTLAAFEYQDYPFGMLVEKLTAQRDLSRNPIFDVVFALQNQVEQREEKKNGLRYKQWDFPNQVAKFDLTLTAVETTQGMNFHLEYYTPIFEGKRMERFGNHFVKILEEVSQNPEILVSDVNILSQQEREQLVYDFNQTQVDYPRYLSIPALFAEQVELRGDAPALVYRDTTLTYKELDARSNQLAHKLREMGLEPDKVAAIISERSLEMVIGVLAIVKAGGAYLPIDLNYPQERMEYMLADAQAEIVLLGEEAKNMISQPAFEFTGQILELKEPSLYSGEATPLEDWGMPNDLIYIIYTSGSTGKPKGVMVEHQNVNRLVKNSNMLTLTAEDRILQTGSLAFDASTFEIWGTLLNGACLYLVDQEVMLSPKALGEKLLEYQISWIWLTAPFFHQLYDAQPEIFAPLQVLIVGGDILSPPHINGLRQKYPGLRVINGYGPTESTTFTTFYQIQQEFTESIPIGRPVSNTQVYIFDQYNQLAPIGVPGELCIGGDGLARGYLNQPELTEEKFVPNPLFPGERMYRTGDLACWQVDGTIEFLGRLDHQVKIRGFRIEPGEIENILLEHPQLKETIVMPKENEQGQKELCAYVVARDDSLHGEGLREYLKERIPEHMIPSYFVFLNEMPLNLNGKVDRQALPVPEISAEVNENYVAPRTPTEIAIAEMWQEILGVQQVGIDDNFFDLGGHSLKAASLASRIYRKFQQELSLQDFFKEPTIRHLAGRLEKTSERTGQLPEIVSVTQSSYPVSSAQKRLYLLEQMDDIDTSYNIPEAVLIEGELDWERFSQALQLLIDRQSALRTYFQVEEGETVQKIMEQVEFIPEYMEIPGEWEDEKIQGIIQEFIRPFDLTIPPLFRVKMIVCQGRQLLLLDMHHIISDGFSMEIFISELLALYQGETLAELAIEYKDYAVWEKELLASKRLARAKSFWLEQLAGELPVLELPTDHPRPPVFSYAGANIHFAVDAEMTGGLKQLAKNQGATLYMVLLSAFQLLLYRYTGQEDLVVGSPIAGRTLPELEKIIGMFVNTLVLRNQIHGNMTYQEFLAGVKEGAIHAFDEQIYPFEMLVDELDLRRDLSRNPIFDVAFALQNQQGKEKAEFGNIHYRSWNFANHIAKFDLSLLALEKEGQLYFNLEYYAPIFNEERMERFTEHLTNIFTEMIQYPEKKIAEMNLLSEDEREQLISGFNQTQVDYPRNQTISNLFKEQVERWADKEALVFAGETLTYRELDRRSNQLAQLLRKKGVEPGQVVAIISQRSLEMIISVLAIVKAGGAYLPIDLNYPPERINYMFQDAQVLLLLKGHEADEIIQSVDFDFGGDVLDIEDPALYQGVGADVTDLNKPQDLLYIIYTSGSTGKPKGVMVEHYNVNRLVKNSNMYDLNPRDRILQTGSLAFDASTFEIWGSLLNGACLYLIKKDHLLSPETFAAKMAEYQISRIFMTTPLFNQYFDAKPEIFGTLNQLIIGGVVASPPHINGIRQMYPDLKLLNAYGPTESTTFATFYLVDRDYSENVPIGIPISNTQVYIFDAYDQLAPIGVVGELCIGGDGLARGYLNQPELTAEKFVPNPLFQDQLMYRTGDLARWRADGNLEFVGRKDNQVKIRGFRIEPGEVEAALLLHPLVKETVVIPGNDDQGNKYLCAYVLEVEREKEESALSPMVLREHLLQELPEHMIPSYFVLLEEIPLTTNGKIRVDALPEPDVGSSLATPYVKPRNEKEERLAQIWAEVLHVQQVGIDDNFFELGGHSLKATTLTSHIYKEFGVEVPLRKIFTHPTIRQLVEVMAGFTEGVYTAIEPAPEAETYPLTSAQKRQFMLDQLEEVSTSYNMPIGIVLEGRLDPEKFRSAFQGLIQRHSGLRTYFTLKKGKPVQKIVDEMDCYVPYEIVADEWDESAAAECLREFTQPFDLSTPPLVRAKLLKWADKHLFLVDMHHIISDGVSMDVLMRDLLALYQGVELAPLRLQYKDVAVWQEKQREELINDAEFWLAAFSGEIPLINLPTDRPRPPVFTFAGDHLDFALSEELTKKVHQLTEAKDATLYMVLLAAFHVLLAKYTGQDDLVVGSPIAGRPHPDLEKIIGMFVNTLAMRNHLQREMTFAEFLGQVATNALNAFEHQNYQFEQLIEELDLRRDLSRNPLFDVSFILQNQSSGWEAETDELHLRTLHFANKQAKFDLTLAAIENDGKLQFNLEYYTEIFNRERMERFKGHFIRVLEQITENPDIRIKDIHLLSPEAEEEFLVSFNQTQLDYPREKTLPQLLEEMAKREPEDIALLYPGGEMTYDQLNRRSNQLARKLRQLGLQPEEMVAIMIERSPEMIVGLWGILKAGGAYVPIDPDYPRERIQYFLEDTQAKIFVSARELLTTDHRHFLEEMGVSNIIDLKDEGMYLEEDGNLPGVNHSTDLAYVIYTSGSTGKPKGVQIEHGFVINRLTWFQEKYPVSQKDRVLQKTTFTFDVSVWEIFWWSLNGAQLCLLPPGGEKEPAVMVETIEKYKITTVNFVPSMTQAFLDYLESHDALDRVSSLRDFFSSGEALKPELLQRFNRLIHSRHQTRIYNLYGPTEATVEASYYDCSPGEDLTRVPIGKPLGNTRLYVLDPDHNLQPIGVDGELYIAGEGLARGYLNRPELTAERFLPDPFVPGERMYKTGDLARWLPDGNIAYLGRIDHQVKIRGFRIELGEIESQLAQHPAVSEVVVKDWKDEQGLLYLAAYLVITQEVETAELRQILLTHLPEYMVPSHFVILDELPHNQSGKVDRKRLPKPSGTLSKDREYVPPQTDLEVQLAEIWSQVLGLEQIGRNDHFFELGGHSLKGITLAGKIFEQTGVELSLRQIFKTPTLEEMAAYIDGADKQNYAPIPVVAEQEYYPVSSAQRRLFVLGQLEEPNTSYNMPQALIIRGELDRERLASAIQDVINRHDSLRTSFTFMDGEPMQKVAENVTFDWTPVSDVTDGIDSAFLEVATSLSEELARKQQVSLTKEMEGQIQQMIYQFIRPFDLNEAPLLRVGCKELAPQEYLLLLDMHHIISDGTSMHILVRDIIQRYVGEELPELRVQYKDFVAWQEQLFQSEKLQAEEKFWLDSFAGEIPVLDMPTDYPRKAVKDFSGDLLTFEIEPELTRALNELAVEKDATLYMVLLAAYNLLLYRYTGQEDMVIGSPIAGRNHSDLENIIGFFINTLALRNQPQGEKRFSQFLQEVKDGALQAYENQNYQFEMLVEKLDLARDLSRNPLFDQMFVFQNVERTAITLDNLEVLGYEFSSGTAKFDILLSGEEMEDRLVFALEYSTSLFKRQTMERFVQHFKQILVQISQNPESKLRDFRILTPGEQTSLCQEWNGAEMEIPEQTISQLFEEQVTKTPHQKALVFEEKGFLTYEELNWRANFLAAGLRTMGVHPGTLVGLMVERSLEMVIGILGILKAGGAYLPLDPNYPEERLEYMVEDSGVQILLTQKEIATINGYRGQRVELDQIFGSSNLGQSMPLTSVSLGDWPGGTYYHQAWPNLEPESSPADLVYVIYTSGSTGKPKGVMLKQENLMNLITYQQMMTNIDPSKVLQFASISFDVSAQEIFTALLSGGELYLVSNKRRDQISELLQYIGSEEIKTLFMPVAFVKYIFGEEEFRNQFPTCIRHIITAGEQLMVIQEFKAYLQRHGVFLHNHYGPSETHVVTSLTLNPREGIPELPSIGRPISNTQIYILDEGLNPQPIGVRGELYIAGANVGQGYLHRPELTAEKFVDNPFTPGEKMYRTGDLARWLDDGTIQFLGRGDDQVKIRGFRIELGEIEHHLLNHPELREVAVVDRQDKNQNKYLVAYYVASGELKALELREFLSQTLPDYMIPGYFIQMEALPLTPSGKIQRRALPEPDLSQTGGREYIAPRTSLEKQLALIWQEVLGIEQVGIRDHFFEMGGHSLKATSLVSRIYQELGVQIPLREILRKPTIEELAQVIAQSEVRGYRKITPATKREYYPVSAGQKRLYLVNQRNPRDTSYNMPGVLTIKGQLDEDKFISVFEKLIDHHEPLRTSFTVVNGQVVQKVHDSVKFNVNIENRDKELTPEEMQSETSQFIQPFELEQAPLLRVKLVNYKGCYLFLFDLHHIISDGISMQLLLQDFATLYAEEPLPELPIQYKDFAVWQETMLKDTGGLKEQESYWLDQLEGMEYTEIPRTVADQRFTERTGQVVLTIADDLLETLDAFCVKHQLTRFHFFLTVFKIVVSRKTGQQDLTIGIPIAGRNQSQLERIMGLFLNVLLIRSQISEKMSFGEYLSQVTENSLEAFENQDYPFDLLFAKIKEEQGYLGEQLFSILFNYLPSISQKEIELEEMTIQNQSIDDFEGKYDVTLYVTEPSDNVHFRLVYDRQKYEPYVMEKILQDLLQVTELVLSQEEILIQDISWTESPELEDELFEEFADLDDLDFI